MRSPWLAHAAGRTLSSRIFREAMGADRGADSPPHNLLDTTTLIRVRPATGQPLRRTPPERPDRIKYTVNLQYTVTRNGRVDTITVLESNAPKHIDDEAIADLRRFRFRPRFENGEPIDTPGLHHRAHIYARQPRGDVHAARANALDTLYIE